ncbi:polysaccharide biosynthesis C-terminal domain-containing protein [Picrophilus oshimae]|uniref:Heteropolysaccharide repeat unit export protein n=1 Tax=Picrophilus torridus (strain ATCC 700027 / DSM 9790 / JCM 10055 / NBRC 100828 / KAW 2/3) TaxID=1122961 RepID=Q6L2C0_PICTO|nr:polysaccharide biosynthesis C-terminal domain-containing protein [Picrophilus oshimae]AAT42882.1 heteropolysaccharide repeat unit export protein [Picrophilus oshimae DSM 9789]
MKSQSFISGVIFQYGAVLSLYLSSFIFYFIVAHILPTYLVGVISLLLAILNIFYTVFALGLGTGMQHFISYHLARNNINTIRRIIKDTSLIGILLSAAAFLFTYFSSSYISTIFFHSIKYSFYIKIIGIGISGDVLMNIFSSMLLGLNYYRAFSITNIITNISGYFIPLSLFLITKDFEYFIFGFSLSYAFYASIYISMVIIFYFRLVDGNNEDERYLNVLKYSIPVFISGIFGTGANYMDRIIVSYFVNLSYLGIYNFAIVITSAVLFLLIPVFNIILPRLSYIFSVNDESGFKTSLRLLLNFSYILYVPAAFGISALSRYILFLFAGPMYLKAAVPMTIILISTSLFSGSYVFSNALSSTKRTRIFIISSGLAMLANIILSFLLIPVYGITGAAISYSSMNGTNFIILYYFARNFVKYDLKIIFKIFASSIFMSIILFYLGTMLSYGFINLFILIILGALIYAMEIKIFKIISREDGILISSLIGNIKVFRFILKILS